MAGPTPGETVRVIEQGFRQTPVPRLRAALKEDSPLDVRGELRGIVEERYDMVDNVWPLLAVIERSAVEFPDLEEFYYRRARSGFFARLAQYLEVRASQGYLRAMPDNAVTARLVSETITWFAWKRREGRDARVYDDETVKQTVVEFVCDALVPEGPS